MSEFPRAAAGRLGRLSDAYLRRRYGILFYSLVLTLAVGPLADALGFDPRVVELLLATNLLAAVLPIKSGAGRRLLLVVLVLAWTLRFGPALLGRPQLARESLGLWTILALLGAANALRFTLGASEVTAEHLYAALSAYVLAGLFFGVFYWVLEYAWAGSFGGGTEGGFPLATANYFSFVTLATLGYGDLVPRSEVARGLAIVEAVAGQLYLAVMVARLVSLYVLSASGERRR